MEVVNRINRIFDDSFEDDELVTVLQQCVEEEKQRTAAESSRPRLTRTFIQKDRKGVGRRLEEDYFSNNPKYTPIMFKRRFRMRRELFIRIVADITSYSVEPIRDHFVYFKQCEDATGRRGFTALQKCTSAIRQLTYGTSADMFDEYLQMAERKSADCLNNYCKCIFDLYSVEYLRRPNASDIARLYKVHEEKHGFIGMLGNIDCMH